MEFKKVFHTATDELNQLDEEYLELKEENHNKRLIIRKDIEMKSVAFKKKSMKRSSQFDVIRKK